MNPTDRSSLAILVTGIFSDGGTVEGGLMSADGSISAQRIELQPDRMTGEDWDSVVREILSAKKVVAL